MKYGLLLGAVKSESPSEIKAERDKLRAEKMTRQEERDNVERPGAKDRCEECGMSSMGPLMLREDGYHRICKGCAEAKYPKHAAYYKKAGWYPRTKEELESGELKQSSEGGTPIHVSASVKAGRYHSKVKAKVKAAVEVGKTYNEAHADEPFAFRVVDKGTGKEMSEKYPKAWEECKTHMSYDMWPGFLKSKSPVCVVLYEGFAPDDLSFISEDYANECEETDGFTASVKAEGFRLTSGVHHEVGKTYTYSEPNGQKFDFSVDENGDRTLSPWEGGAALVIRDSEGDGDKIDEILSLVDGFSAADLADGRKGRLARGEEPNPNLTDVEEHKKSKAASVKAEDSALRDALAQLLKVAENLPQPATHDGLNLVDALAKARHALETKEEIQASVKADEQCGETEFIKNRDGKWVILDSKTGKVLSHHDSCKAAHDAMKALQFHKHEGA